MEPEQKIIPRPDMPDVEGGDLSVSEIARKRDSAIAAIILGLWTAFSVT